MTLFAADLFFVGAPAADTTRATLLGVGEFLGAPGGLRIAADLLLFSVFSGFFTVPLYTMVQERSAPSMRARVIAGNNILNALFMVLSAVLLMALMAADLSIPQLFGVLAVLNAIVAFTIYQIIPEFALRFVIWMLCRVMYRLTVNDGDRIPREGPVVLVCNHISFVDWLLVTSACRRPPRFVMYHRYFHIPVVGWFFRDGKVIPIAPAHEDEGTLNAAFDQIARELENGEVVCIFPEGKVTRDGRMNPFRTGIERIIARTPVPVVPMGLIGMWGSAFSHQGAGPFRRYRARLTLNVGEPIAPTDVTAAELGRRVAALAEMDPPAVPDA